MNSSSTEPNADSLQRITSAIPHRPPFLFLDEVVAEDDQRIVARKRFTGEEAFFAGHYPGRPLVPGVLLCEAAMQAGAVLMSRIGMPDDGTVPVVTRLENVRFKQPVLPGQTIEIDVQLTDQLSNAFVLVGKVSVEGRVVARLEFTCMLAKIAD